MIRTIALASIYLFLLYAFAEGIRMLSGNTCSEWVVSCPADRIAMTDQPDEEQATIDIDG